MTRKSFVFHNHCRHHCYYYAIHAIFYLTYVHRVYSNSNGSNTALMLNKFEFYKYKNSRSDGKNKHGNGTFNIIITNSKSICCKFMIYFIF